MVKQIIMFTLLCFTVQICTTEMPTTLLKKNIDSKISQSIEIHEPSEEEITCLINFAQEIINQCEAWRQRHFFKKHFLAGLKSQYRKEKLSIWKQFLNWHFVVRTFIVCICSGFLGCQGYYDNKSFMDEVSLRAVHMLCIGGAIDIFWTLAKKINSFNACST